MQADREHAGQAMHPGGDRDQAFGSVPDRVRRRHVRQQRLRRADVAGRLFAADVLLAGLQRQAQRAMAVAILADADQPAGDRALQRVADREERRVRAAIAERHAEPLGGAQRDVGAERSRRLQHGQRQRVAGDAEQRAMRVQLLGQGAEIADRPIGAGILHQRADHRCIDLHAAVIGDAHLDADFAGAGPHHIDGLRMHLHRDQEDAAIRLAAGREVHRLGRRGRLIEQAGVGHRQPGQLGDQGLEVSAASPGDPG